jgi:hypothetical protein
MTLSAEERARRAAAIRALLDDANIKAAFAQVEADLVDEWRRCFDAQERDNLWRALQATERVQTWLRSGASADLTALRRGR